MLQNVLRAAERFAKSYRYDRISPAHLLAGVLEDINGVELVSAEGVNASQVLQTLKYSFRNHSMSNDAPAATVTGGDAAEMYEDALGAPNPLRYLVATLLTCDDEEVVSVLKQGRAEARSDEVRRKEAEAHSDNLDRLIEEVSKEDAGRSDLFSWPDVDEVQEYAENPPARAGEVARDPGTSGLAAEKPAAAKRPQSKKAENPYGLEAEEKSNAKAIQNAIRDVSSQAIKGELDHISGRDSEISKIIEILMRRRKSNIILVAEPGVGKTALIDGLAQSLCGGAGPLSERPILEVSLSSLVGGTRFRGDFESRMDYLMRYSKKRKAVLFIDELHTFVGAGSSLGGGMDCANILKPALAREGFSLIGATTPRELDALREDTALMRRFEIIRIEEPDIQLMKHIIKMSGTSYLTHHGVVTDSPMLEQLVELAHRYLPTRRFPDKAFDVLDGACVKTRLAGRKELAVHDLRESIRSLGGLLPTSTQGAEMIGKLRRSKILRTLHEHVAGHDQAIYQIAKYCAQQNKAGTPTINIEGPTGIGRRHIGECLTSVLKLEPLRVDGETCTEEKLNVIADKLERAPSTILLINADQGMSAELTAFTRSMAKDGYALLKDGRKIWGKHAAIFAWSLKPQQSIGFGAASSGGLDLGASALMIKSSLFEGDALRSAVTFCLDKIKQVSEDAGDFQMVPSVDCILSELPAFATWEQVKEVSALAAERIPFDFEIDDENTLDPL